jgi:hypothetical protein
MVQCTLVLWAAALVTAACVAPCTASPFDPHPLNDVTSGNSFFEGWYHRVTDHERGLSFAVIFGSLQLPHSSSIAQNWAALLLNRNGSTETVQLFATNASVAVGPARAPVTKQPDLVQPSNFYYETSAGSLLVDDQKARLVVDFPGRYVIEVVADERVPWNVEEPNGDGPESWLSKISSLLPCHYYVHSLASRARYSIRDAEGRVVEGTGFAHLETNYGVSFPSAWAWGEGVSVGGAAQFVFTAGQFTIAGVKASTFALAYRSPALNLTFRSPDLAGFSLDKDACAGSLRLQAHDALSTHRATLTVTAPPASFSAPLYCPTTAGFKNVPGSVESFAGTAVLDAYSAGALVESTTFPLSALEFGGGFVCGQHTQ